MDTPNPGKVEEPKVTPPQPDPATGTPPVSQNKGDEPKEPPKEPVEPPKEPPVEPSEPPKEPPKPSVNVQERINRMYARLQKEREARVKAENANKAKDLLDGQEPTDGEEPPKGLTEADVERIMAQKERQRKFTEVESEVFKRHPEALNEDGSFNMEDPFMKKYLEIGKKSPLLATLEDGPLLAEARAEKELGVDYKKGTRAEASRQQDANNAHTLSSTTKPPKPSAVVLTPEEKRIAARMGLTEQEYFDNKKAKK